MLEKMDNAIQEKLAKSLTAETTDLLPFLPYLLQDLWELGSSPADIVKLMQKHMPIHENTKVLDLACGKGAVCIKIAQELKASVKGIDIISDFIEYAKQKAVDFHVSALCQFAVEDINIAIDHEKNYDCVIYGAVGDVLGTPEETIIKLKSVIKPNGYIICDDAYLQSDKSAKIKFHHDYLTYEQWLELFDKTGVKLVDSAINENDEENDSNTQFIITRANELIEKYPQKRQLFESYIQSQINECDDLENCLVGITWLLQGK